MSLPQKIDRETLNTIRTILSKHNLTTKRITIDFERETIQADDDYSIDDILEAAGTLTPERAKELLNETKKYREEW